MDLPVDAVLPQLKDALRTGTSAVLVAAPGAGKSTRAPLALLDEPWAAGKRILLLSPRRVAARATAARMAQTLGESVGDTIGYRVRLESRVSARTRIEVVTEGVFTRRVLSDPSLGEVGAVLFDEFHERSIDGDLGLALALDVQGALREDLRLVVMSATIDGARVAGLMGGAPVIVSEGRMHPVRDRYLGRRRDVPLEQAMGDAIIAALAGEEGSILCFLPGAREIERTRQRLEGRVAANVDIHALYGALDPRAQDEAIAPARAGRRKVVLATSIAETSLTIEGVRVVIDSGLSRRPRYEPGAGLSRLETVRESRASAEQRKGRAGRLEPGVCWRLWDEPETRSMIPFDRPEMLDADLTGLALDLAAWGVSDPATLRWLDAPAKAAWREAVGALGAIGAIDEAGAITEEGKAISALPVHPRLAHMIVRGADAALSTTAAMIAVLLSEQGLGGRDADLGQRVDSFLRERGPRAESARRLAQRLAARVGAATEERVAPELAGLLLLHAFPERVARRRDKRGEFLMANGRAAVIDAVDPLARHDFIVIADVSGAAERPVILAAAAVAEADVIAACAGRIETRDIAAFDAASGQVRVRRVVRLGAITLSETPVASPPKEALAHVMLDAVRAQGLSLIPWGEEATQARARVALMRRLDGDDAWPDLSDAALLARLEEWLLPLLEDTADLRALNDQSLAAALLSSLDYAQRRQLDEDAPTHFISPADGRHRIDYAAENGPALDIRLQELFGMATHPAVARGRAPLLLRLLSPARRPVQTTRDLPGFWTGSYAAVRAEMKGRYPRHPWPDDPAAAEPTRRAKPKGT